MNSTPDYVKEELTAWCLPTPPIHASQPATPPLATSAPVTACSDHGSAMEDSIGHTSLETSCEQLEGRLGVKAIIACLNAQACSATLAPSAEFRFFIAKQHQLASSVIAKMVHACRDVWIGLHWVAL